MESANLIADPAAFFIEVVGEYGAECDAAGPEEFIAARMRAPGAAVIWGMSGASRRTRRG